MRKTRLGFGNENSSTSTKRLQYFAVVFLLTFILYILINIFVAVLDHCWAMSDFWLSDELVIKPFWGFCLVFGFLLVWAFVELYLSWMGPKDQRVSGVVITSFFAFLLTSLGIGLYTHWQMLQIEQGNLTFDDYWIKTTDRLPFVDHWDVFLKHKRCVDGIDWYKSTDEVRCNMKEYKLEYPNEPLILVL